MSKFLDINVIYMYQYMLQNQKHCLITLDIMINH